MNMATFEQLENRFNKKMKKSEKKFAKKVNKIKARK